jgi:DNA excision repair protein ERCC-3
VNGPLIVQSDRTLLLEVDHADAERCRAAIASFAELETAPEHVHTYRITPLALWNARAAGIDAETVVDALTAWSRFPVPPALLVDVAETMARYGRLVLEQAETTPEGAGAPAGSLVLRASALADLPVLEEVVRAKAVAPLVTARLGPIAVAVPAAERGRLKQALVKLGWPCDDQAGHREGAACALQLRDTDLRPYQEGALTSFLAAGSGVVVLPCGAGKTIVGAATMAKVGAQTLILVTNTVAARQWRRELLERTTLRPEEIGEYSGERKDVRPVTIATYQVLITKRKGEYPHLALFSALDWGLVVYDEVHLLPAPVFRMTAEIQSRRRLGLTATLVREDGRESDVFSLIGPKRFDAPWRDIEAQGWIAPAQCIEVRVALTQDERMAYALAEPDIAYRVGSTAASKIRVVERVLARHPGEPTLVIGQYIDQLERLAARLDAPLITGKTPNREREELFARFREGDVRLLVVSKVANFSIDLPEATVGVQISGTFGSRQEEAQRLGRILRPKGDGRQAWFYAIVSRDTNDQTFAANRQRFLAEQGYAYEIVDAADL